MTRSPHDSDSDELEERVLTSELLGRIGLDFLIAGELHPCPYLPGRQASEEAFLVSEFSPEFYHDLMDHGFRRSGFVFYRPVCPFCDQCIPLRVRTADFSPSKSIRRVIRKNSDVTVKSGVPKLTDEKRKIYARYLAIQHASSKEMTEEDLESFLYASPVLTVEFEYRVKGRLMAVGIVDVSSRSFSSVYTYFDPEFSHRSPGTFSAAHEIMICRDKGIPYYYLGYYVPDSPSMSYKKRFRPCEILTPERRWVPLEAGAVPKDDYQG
jgi:arginine-tRNA-protein transferase